MRGHPRLLFVIILGAALVLAGCGDVDAPAAPDVPEPDPEPVVETFDVYYTNLERGEIGEVFPVDRETAEEDVPQAALNELLAGPTEAEEAEGFSSWFSTETEGMLTSVDVTDGVARVDFDAALSEIIPGASTSAGSTALLAELEATVTQFPDIDRAIYSLDGDVDAFYHWLQRDPPG